MYSYIKGQVVELYSDYIVLDHHDMGYEIHVSNPYSFTKGQNYTVYVYQQVKEDGHLLFGFKTKEEKELFLKLIKVKGIGPKSAIGILATGEVDAIIQAIESENVSYLKKIPGIGPKAAGQIILDLKGKFNVDHSERVLHSESYEEAIEVLVALGYRPNDVKKAMKVLEKEKLDTNGYVKRALALIVK